MRFLSIGFLIGSLLWLPSRALNAYIPTYGAVLLEMQPVPNPNPYSMALHVDRDAALVRLRFYSRAGILMLDTTFGGGAANGWSQVGLPPQVAQWPNGTYYVLGNVQGAESDWSEARGCAMVILK